MYNVKNKTEAAFFKELSSYLITGNNNSNNVNVEKFEVKLGTMSNNDSDKIGHLYGIHTWENVDEPNTLIEYPVGIDIVIMSMANTQPLQMPQGSSNDAKNLFLTILMKVKLHLIIFQNHF